MNISIILAAGEGTRMKSSYSKVLHKICNKPILEYVIEASKGAKVDKNIVIVGENEDAVRQNFSNDLILKRQPIGDEFPYGTGYAVMQAIDEIEDDSKVLILYGDTPLITKETISEFFTYQDEHNLDATVLTAIVDNPKDYGRIIRKKDGSVLKIVEEKDASQEEKEIKEINSGIYIFKGELLKKALKETDNNNAQNEYYVTDVIEILEQKGYKIGAYIVEDPREIHGVNSRLQLSQCQAILRSRINEKHMSEGVTFIDPNSSYIDPDVIIGKDTIIYPGVVLEGSTKIGDNCIIRGSTRITDSQIEDSVHIESSVIEDSLVKNNTKIGPFTHIRPNSQIGEDVKLGNFVEIKNSKIGKSSKASHLSYIGDSELGEGVNVGCGVVFANYDGKNKHKSIVDNGAFIGSNSSIISPVNIGQGSFIAAGSTITDSVEEGKMAIARARQVVKNLKTEE